MQQIKNLQQTFLINLFEMMSIQEMAVMRKKIHNNFYILKKIFVYISNYASVSTRKKSERENAFIMNKYWL